MILQNRLSLNKLSLKKIAVKLSPETIDKAFKQNDAAAMNEVADAVIKMVNAVINKLHIREKYGYDVMNDFRSEVLTKLFDYSLERFDPLRASLSTFVYTHVGNEWKNFQNKEIRRLQRELSTETPLGGGEGFTLGETLEDPRSVDFVSAQEAAQMYEELQNELNDSRYKEIFRLWVDDTALNDELETIGQPVVEKERNAKQKADDIAKIINAKFPDRPLSAIRVNRVIHDIVKELVRKKFPEEVPGSKTVSPIQEEVLPNSPEIPVEPGLQEQEKYIPFEERPAPAYRINPQTGERTLISLNLRRKLSSVKYSQDRVFNTIMTWLSIELNGKLK
jgi:hypothetical protein